MMEYIGLVVYALGFYLTAWAFYKGHINATWYWGFMILLSICVSLWAYCMG
jgi:hypothetical protein